MISRPIAERFRTKFVVDPTTNCWNWTAHKNPQGYGMIWDRGTSLIASRVSWELYKGPIPEGMFVLHKCDNPACVNPDHEFLGTQDDNMKDAARKGRAKGGSGEVPEENRARGVTNGMAKLTEDQVRYARRSPLSCPKLAKELGVSISAIYNARNGITWGHIE